MRARPPRGRSARRLIVCLLTAGVVGSVLSLALLANVSFLSVWKRSLADLLFTEGRPTESIVIVAIDDASLARIGRWPWPRSVHARLLETLSKAGAKAVGLDIGLSEPAADDARLAAAMAGSVPVVVPVFARLAAAQPLPLRSLATTIEPPAATIRGGKTGTGHVAITPDGDGVVRSLPLMLTDSGSVYPGFSSALLSRCFSVFTTPTPSGRASVRCGVRDVPVEAGGRMRLDYVGPPGTFKTYPYADVLDRIVPPSVFHDKIVLVGASALGLGDSHMTPVSRGQPMPGVEIQANAMHTILSGRFLAAQPVWEVVGLVFALAIAGSALAAYLKGVPAALTALALLMVVLLLSVWRFERGVVPDLVYPPLALLVGFGAVATYRFGFEEKERRRLQTLFGRYLKPELVARLAESPDESLDALNGTKQTITVLYADIRGFTSLSERLEPTEVVATLDAYLESMTEALFEEDGTLDKYIGDAIMAFFNSPHPQPDHAVMAVRAALKMQARAAAVAVIGGPERPPLRYGIGIHTGEAVVGNVGSRKRQDYTAIGDTVNVAARICSAAGPGEIVLSASTCSLLRGTIPVESLGPCDLKGKSEPVLVYRVVPDAIRPD